MASKLSSPKFSRQSRVAKFCVTKSPRYPARFLKLPERKSSITVRRAFGNFSCRTSARLDPMKPAPPVITKLGEECNLENVNWREIDKSWPGKRKQRVKVRKNAVRNALYLRFRQAISSARVPPNFGDRLWSGRAGCPFVEGRIRRHRNRFRPRFYSRCAAAWGQRARRHLAGF